MKAISLFSGAGGLDVGFKKAGFTILWANDFDKDACETYKNNIGNHIQCGDINLLKQFALKKMPDIDVVFGGPPVFFPAILFLPEHHKVSALLIAAISSKLTPNCSENIHGSWRNFDFKFARALCAREFK